MITSSNPKVRQGMDLVDSMEPEELDQLVDYIRVVFKTKRAQNAARSFAELQVGDPVRLRNIKPQYLIGMTGVIEEKRQTRLVVKLDRGPTKKFHSGRVVCSASSLTKIEEN